MAHRLLWCLLVLTSLSWASSFDQPVRKQTVDLGPSPDVPGTHARVNCYFFPEFMVKEVDMGEVGAERLGILPVTPQSSGKCVKTADAAEKTIRSDDWSGYFMGVKKNYVFFAAADRINSALPFAVFDAGSGKKLFEDSAKADINFTALADGGLSISYLRVVGEDCFILKEANCWERMRAKYGLGKAAAPDCQKGYTASADSLAKDRCSDQKDKLACAAKEIPLALQQMNQSPSVISYQVEVALGAAPVIKPTGGEISCWPAD
ncbi:MAG TPA: hypothetical protein VNW97_21830 [Candidatus Saccharimonadales bacterium]|jgi:hypothetical protein|nr:hypothetical protein [Candidatus Saccharimonadales bacterium]